MPFATMYYVVTRRLGDAMKGSKCQKGAGSNMPKGTVYAIKASPEAAMQYCEDRWGDACQLMIGNTILIVPQ